MKKDLVFATNNTHKLREVISMIDNQFKILSLNDIAFFEDIEESAETLEGNALIKAQTIHEKFGYNVFADDTGLEIEALNGAPGVYSARYAGEDKDPKANMRKVLQELADQKNRKAHFRTVIALILDGKEYLFEGVVNGVIAENETGAEGFGYDPIFIPEGYEQSFAQMGAELKNEISHRGIATRKFIEFLKK